MLVEAASRELAAGVGSQACFGAGPSPKATCCIHGWQGPKLAALSFFPMLLPLPQASPQRMGAQPQQQRADSAWGSMSSTARRASLEPQQETPGEEEGFGFLPLCWLPLRVSQGDWSEKEPALCWGVWKWSLPSPGGEIKAPLGKGRQVPLTHTVPQGRLRYPTCEGKMLLKAREGFWEAGECSLKQKTRFSEASKTEDRVGV